MDLISRDEILGAQPCPPAIVSNLEQLLLALNQFRNAYGHPMIVTSGYRSPEHNAAVGGKPGSAHLTCQAADFSDPERSLRDFCLGNLALLEHCGLWMEDCNDGHVHLQTRAIPSGNRVFKP